jgi:hypothetical protein
MFLIGVAKVEIISTLSNLFLLFLLFLTVFLPNQFLRTTAFFKAGRKDRQVLVVAKYILKILLLILGKPLPGKLLRGKNFLGNYLLHSN